MKFWSYLYILLLISVIDIFELIVIKQRNNKFNFATK